MTLSFSSVFADAGALWRRERRLVAPLAGVFFFLPMLAIVLLLGRIDLAPDATSEQIREALAAFYDANLLAILAINLIVDFGSFALLNLFLQGNGRTLGEVLGVALRRFLPFLLLDLLAGILFGLGASLFLLPGLFVFARTWLAAPAFAARPERGIGGALRDGWLLSRGPVWLVLLGAAAGVILVGLFAILLGSVLIGLAAAALGDTLVMPAVASLLCAGIGAAGWSALTVLRVAAYRRLSDAAA